MVPILVQFTSSQCPRLSPAPAGERGTGQCPSGGAAYLNPCCPAGPGWPMITEPFSTPAQEFECLLYRFTTRQQFYLFSECHDRNEQIRDMQNALQYIKSQDIRIAICISIPMISIHISIHIQHSSVNDDGNYAILQQGRKLTPWRFDILFELKSGLLS